MKKISATLLALALSNTLLIVGAGAADFSGSDIGARNLQHMNFQNQVGFQGQTSPFQDRPALFQSNGADFRAENLGTTDFGATSAHFAEDLQRRSAQNDDRSIHFADRSADFSPQSRPQFQSFANMKMRFENPALQFLNFNSP